jgi:hypothetical protein
MTFIKKIGWSLLLLVLFGATFAQNPSYNFAPASGAQLKLHCNYNGNLYLMAWWLNYNAFEATISFDSSNISLIHGTVNSPFSQNQWDSLVWNLYKTYGALPWGQKSAVDVNAITFGFKTLNNILSSTFSFTDRLWNAIVFWPSTTDDWATLNGFDVNGADILTAVNNATYTFFPLPCVPDATNPTITTIIPSNGSRYIPSNQVVSFTTYDWAGAGTVNGPSPLATNNRSHYWYQGLATGVLSNYVSAPATVDNQEGINSSTIKATVSCPTCTSFGGPYVLTASNLIISDWLGDGSRHQYTWDSQRRGYDVSFAAPAPYEVEKTVTVTFEAVDNPNETWAIHTGTASVSFNTPQNPIITRLLPSTDTFVSPSKANPIRLFVSDDWAGINTGSVKITIPKIMSWAEQLMTGYTYSWSELAFTLSWWASGLWNSGKYIIDFYPLWDFPANETVTITWIALDLASNTWTFTTSFTTRPDCSFFGCNEILNINILDGNFAWLYEFTGTILVVTGTNPNSPYPYLTWANNDILMCGIEWTWAILTWNVSIYDSSNNQINWNLYTGSALYITGLNFTIVDWVIVVQ